MKQQLQTMLTLQDKMNTKVHENWQAQNFAWFRAMWIECGELVDHYGYKWWKKQTPDMQQVQLEVVDIWHFGLSMLLDGRGYEEIAKAIESDVQDVKLDGQKLGVIEATEALAESVLSTKAFNVTHFFNLMHACDLSFDELFKQYVGKNVLNFFRQDHGYKDGSYIKIWNGKEDNEYLSQFLNELDSKAEDFAEQLYKSLSEVYQTL